MIGGTWNTFYQSQFVQPGNYGNFIWYPTQNAVRYAVFVDDFRDGFATGGSVPSMQAGACTGMFPLDYCNLNVGNNFLTYQFVPGNHYGINVYAINSCNQASVVAYGWVYVEPDGAACVPDCTGELCGQADGCGGVCAATDDQTVGAPTLMSPADDAQVLATDSTSGGQPTKAVPLQVRTQSNNVYDPYYTHIEVYPAGTNCSNSQARCVTIGTNVANNTLINYTFHISASSYGNYNRFQWRARHQNNTCTDKNGTWTSWRYFNLADSITGEIRKDDGAAGLSGGLCISPFAAVAYTPESGDVITARRSGTDYPGTLNSDGTFSVLVPVSTTGQNVVEFENAAADATCGCPTGCSYSGIDSPQAGVVFYYQSKDIRDPWWQTIGGTVYGGRTTSSLAVQSKIPDTCFGTCLPYLNLLNDTDTADSSGGVITGGGSIDVSLTAGNQTSNIDEDARNYRVVGTTTDALLENYDYFYRLYSMGITPTNDINSPSSKPSSAPSNGRAHYRNGNLAINSAWSVGSNESIVVFVNGDLTVNNTISVAQGGFLAFIVNGNITYTSTVCQSDPESTTARVAGVFVADGTMTVASDGNGDCKFVGEGIFAALSGVNLNRDFRDGATDADFLNARNPVELFRYRPDLVRNIPARMTRPFYQWLEVAP